MRPRTLLPLAFLVACASRVAPAPPPRAPEAPVAPVGSVAVLAGPRRAPRAGGRAGDLVLRGARGEVLVVAAAPDLPGHLPQRGAVLDVHVDAGDRTDPLLWWMPGVIDAEGGFHTVAVSSVEPAPCGDGRAGVRVEGTWGPVRVERWHCASRDGGFELRTRALTALPAGARLGEEIIVGKGLASLNRVRGEWQGGGPNDFLAVAEGGVAAMLSGPAMRARQGGDDGGAEVLPIPVRVWHEGAEARETLRVRGGDVFDALGLAPGATREVTVRMPAGRRAELTLLDPDGAPLARGELAPSSERVLTLPSSLRGRLHVRDDRGIASDHPLSETTAALTVPPQPAGVVHLRVRGPGDAPLPVHVLFRGLGGTHDPEPTATAPDVAAGRSLYLRRGEADVWLAPGRYRVVATHGFTWSLDAREVTVTDGGELAFDAALRPVTDTGAWVSGDFHLHAAPSPDSALSLEARVLSLACEGVDLAVATDHNRITDYAPVARALGLADVLATLPGDELTPGGRAWGHFNAFPLAPGGGAPDDEAPAYFDQTPTSIFAAARESGARVVQVNHPRMGPYIGYFNVANFDARTGRADATFADGFDALEAYNGLWIESPDRVREGLRDAVGLARRGMRPALTGNSDSHALLFEEAGYPRTFLRAQAGPVATRGARAIEALLRRETTVSSGPFVEVRVGDAQPGATVRPSRGVVRLHVRVSAPAWVPVERVEVWRDDVVVRSFPVTAATDGVRFERDVDVPVARDAVVTAWADAETSLPDVLPYGRARSIGFAGFVYVDADGDGRAVPPPGDAPGP